MSTQRLVTIVVAGGSLAAWLAAAATSGHRVMEPMTSPATTAVDLHGAELAGEIARLHERLRPTAAPRLGRNLFRFAPRKSYESPRALPVPAQTEAAAMPRPVAPALKLIGLAEDDGPDGSVRTAIISASGELILAKVGDEATAKYRVTRISSEVVELADVVDGSLLRLALK